MAEDQPRRRLGRGLAALIGDATIEPEETRKVGPQKTLPVGFLRPNPQNPRKAFDPDDLGDLACSIKERGVVQPILVRPHQHGRADRAHLVLQVDAVARGHPPRDEDL